MTLEDDGVLLLCGGVNALSLEGEDHNECQFLEESESMVELRNVQEPQEPLDSNPTVQSAVTQPEADPRPITYDEDLDRRRDMVI